MTATQTSEKLERLINGVLARFILPTPGRAEIAKQIAAVLNTRDEATRPAPDALREALTALVNKLDEIEAYPGSVDVFAIAGNHGFPYTGPTYEKELKEARAALASPPTHLHTWTGTGVDTRCSECGVSYDLASTPIASSPFEVLGDQTKRVTLPPIASEAQKEIDDFTDRAAVFRALASEKEADGWVKVDEEPFNGRFEPGYEYKHIIYRRAREVLG